MTKENVIKLLSAVSYPGFNRDIVSFGMVKDVIIDDQTLTIELHITSQNEEKKEAVREAVKKKLAGTFKTVNIQYFNASITIKTNKRNSNNVKVMKNHVS